MQHRADLNALYSQGLADEGEAKLESCRRRSRAGKPAYWAKSIESHWQVPILEANAHPHFFL
jgi:hypothetical protein